MALKKKKKETLGTLEWETETSLSLVKVSLSCQTVEFKFVTETNRDGSEREKEGFLSLVLHLRGQSEDGCRQWH